MNSPESPPPDRPDGPEHVAGADRSAEADRVAPPTAADPAEIEDRMFDVLLAELLETRSPPDQCHIIVQRLDESRARALAKKTPRRNSYSVLAWSSLVAVAVALLIAVGVAVGIRYRNAASVASNPAAAMAEGSRGDTPSAQPTKRTPAAAADSDAPVDRSDAKRDASGNLPSRRIELADSDSTAVPAGGDPIEMLPQHDPSQFNEDNSPQPIAQQLTLVSASLSEHLQRYWQRVGLQPTEMMDAETTAARLRTRFGIDVPAAATADVQAMRQALAQSENVQSIAVQVLAAISSRPAKSLTRESDLRMVSEIRHALDSGAGFDRLYASWFAKSNGDNPKVDASGLATESGKAGAALVPIGELLRPLSEHEMLVTTAAVALNADMRCQRCHDLKQVASGHHAAVSQHIYWQFAATVSPSLAIRPNAKSGWFYDTPDGRRRFAEGVSNQNWLDQLPGSRALAQGLVGAIWAQIHGRPLVSSPYDLTGSAEDSGLERLRDDLADDLLAHDFDLLRTISLMLTDSILGRRTPAAMTPAGVLVASDQEWQRAVAAVESFAASPPDAMPSTRGQRLRLVQRSDLPTLRAAKDAIAMLAQPRGSEETGSHDDSPAREQAAVGSAALKPSPAVLAGLPMRPIVVMPAWIVELPDFDSRLQHIAHLAGFSRIPESAQQLATQMREADVEEALILQRIWWIIRPQG